MLREPRYNTVCYRKFFLPHHLNFIKLIPYFQDTDSDKQLIECFRHSAEYSNIEFHKSNHKSCLIEIRSQKQTSLQPVPRYIDIKRLSLSKICSSLHSRWNVIARYDCMNRGIGHWSGFVLQLGYGSNTRVGSGL